MTEAEWNACTDPQPMLEFLRGKASDRRLRLFAVACCNLILYLIPTEESRECVRVSERYADGAATQAELERSIAASMAACEEDADRRRVAGSPWSRIEVEAINAVGRVHRTVESGRFGVLHAAASARACDRCVREAFAGNKTYAREEADGLVVRPEALQRETETEVVKQAMLLRDVVGGLPFRPVTVSPTWLSSTVVSLAKAIYDEGAFDRLPILADALEDAGCTNADILGHCRQAGVHVRGCWAVDLLLGKE